VLLHVESLDRPVRHVYLRGARALRPDLADPEAPPRTGGK